MGNTEEQQSVYEISGANKIKQERRNKFEEKVFHLTVSINTWNLQKQ